MRRRCLSLLPVLFVLAAGIWAGSPSAAGAAAAPTWSLPVLTSTQPPFASKYALSALVCADAQDCLVSGGSDAIYRSVDHGTTWTIARGIDDMTGGPFACAPDTQGTTPFCLAIDAGTVEHLTASGAPVSGEAVNNPYLAAAAALACPTSELCVAAGANTSGGPDGEISSTNTPLAGDWTSVDVDPGSVLTAISCPDIGLCAAVDSGGGVVVSTDPANGGWTRTQVGSGLDQISCPTDQLCVAVSASGQAYVSTDPGTGAWNPLAAPGATDLTGVSCPTAVFCAATDQSGALFMTADPGDYNGDNDAGFTQVIGLSAGLSGISCQGPRECVVLDGANVISTTTGLSAYSMWRYTDVDGWTPLVALSCPSAALCVAPQSDGRFDSSTTPLKAGDAWTVSPADHGHTPVAIDCPSSAACFAVDTAGGLLSSSRPGSGKWHRFTLDTKGRPVAISCPTRSFCAVADAAGFVWTSSDPSGGRAQWKRTRVEVPVTVRRQSVGPTGLTCPMTGFCLMTDGDGRILTSDQPASATPRWTATQVWNSRQSGEYSLAGASCATAHACTVLATDRGWLTPAGADPDALGTYALTSTDPTGGSDAWGIRQIDGGYVSASTGTDDPGLATGLSCPTTTLCAMVDELGTAVTNTGALFGRWLSAPIDPHAGPSLADGNPGLTAVSCFRRGHCVAVDGFGDRFIFGVGAGPIAPVYAVRMSD